LPFAFVFSPILLIICAPYNQKCEYEEEFGTQDVASEQEIDARKRSRSKTEEKLSDKSAKQNSFNSSKSISSDSPTSGSHHFKQYGTFLYLLTTFEGLIACTKQFKRASEQWRD